MNKKLLPLLFISAFSLTSCGDTIKRLPDYSRYNDTMPFYAYAAANDGTYDIDDVKYSVGENLATVEQFKMYKEAGFNIFFPQSVARIEAYDNLRPQSIVKAKEMVDKAVEAGLDKTILYDEGLSWLGLRPGGVIGNAADQYPDEDALDEKVHSLVAPYATYPGVYGVIMADEPKNIWCESYGQVYNSIKRVNEKYGYNLYIQFNLNPLIISETVFNDYYPFVENTSDFKNFNHVFTRYKKYLDNFLESMNPDYIAYDSYPMRVDGISYVYLPCLQYVAGLARDRHIDFHNVTQAFAMTNNGTDTYRRVTEADAKWMNNILLGFGVDEISYFTYFTHGGSKSNGEYFTDGAAMVDYYGQKTYLYDIIKNIIGIDQEFAHVYKRFEYVASDVVKKLPMTFPANHLSYFEKDGEFTALKSYSTNKECAFISELYDEENDFYMYDVLNIVDPSKQGSTTYETITLKFDSKYKYALVYRDAVPSYYRLKDGKLNVKAAPGEASFVIPFN